MGWDAELWRLLSVCEVFILLTNHAVFDIVFDPIVHSWPPEASRDLLDESISPCMSCGGSIMEVIGYLLLQLSFGWHHHSFLGVP